MVDRNTKFYHVATSIRKARKRIHNLKDQGCNIISDTTAIKGMVFNYFSSLFADDSGAYSYVLPMNKFPRIADKDGRKINASFMGDEIKAALFDMVPFKAPRLNGYHAGFYQKLRGHR